MEPGDILGHEFMGEVVEVGRAVTNLKVGDRVVVPFTIACGQCFFCQKELWSLCDNSNPNAWMAEKLYGYSPAGLFGYSHMLGGYAGGQAEYVRVPFADVGPIKVPDGADRRAGAVPLRHLPDRLHGGRELRHPAGRHGRGLGLRPGRAVRDQERLPARGRARHRHRPVPERLELARGKGKAETINFDDDDVYERLKEMTGGRGPDACIDAVGMEAHGTTLDAVYDQAKQRRYWPPTGRTRCGRRSMACRKGGTVSIPGVYGGFARQVPDGRRSNKALTIKMGQTHMKKSTIYMSAVPTHQERQNRSAVHHYPPAAARGRAPRATRCSGTSKTTASRWC